jgi:trimeric autotransporter adhesin
MRRVDEPPIGPDVRASLEAIDATLAGEAVDPAHAELAELALLLASDRPELDATTADALDARVDRRFAPPPRPRSRRRWVFAPAAMLALTAAIAVVVVLSAGGSGRFSGSSTSALAPAPGARVPSAAAGASSSAASGTPSAAGTGASSAGRPAPASASPGTATSAAGSAAAPSSAGAGASSPLQPPANGRKIIHSANLALSVSPNQIDDVAQEVFDVIGAQKGIVDHSTVTASGGSDGYADFQLRVPSSALSQTMTELSRLRGANVVSRTDATQDINGQYVATSHALADARALRTALLKQLAGATTTAQIDSLTAQIHDAEASISSDQATLARLNGQVNYSQITLTINATVLPVSSGTSFTVGKAAHDAGRVLMVTAGVALIVLAALVPLGLVGAVVWWVAAAIRRRRREQALDLA